ncbi:MAG: hydrogenase subunit MbhD domain-containing protein [Candidatus Thiodiazotropha sp. L084R]
MNLDLIMLPDLVLAVILIGMAWATLSSDDLRRGVVLFIAFGLLLAIVWARLHAPDLALAEAAIGAGLSGALLLVALRDEAAGNVPAERVSQFSRWMVDLFALIMTCLIGWVLWLTIYAEPVERLAQLANSMLEHTGVSNPVTAVLLNYRSYDTLLELAVVLTAVLGVLVVGRERRGYQQAGLIFCGLVHWLVPLLIVTAGYLLWVGAHAPGGAFQAGATLAAAGILLRLSGNDAAGLPVGMLLRWLLVAGIALFLLVGLGVAVTGGNFLEYPQTWSGTLILLIESAATASIGAALVLAYRGGRPEGWVALADQDNNREVSA